MESWKDIEGYEGEYQVSDLGRVRSLKRHVGNRICNGKVLKPIPNNTNYYQVTLRGDKHLVNRLVCSAFHPNPENKPHVNHLDTITTNNEARNLEWATCSENQLYSTKRIGSDSYRATINEHTVRRIMHLSKTCTKTVIANYFNISYSIVYKILRGESWNHTTGLPRVRHDKFNKQQQLKTAA